MPLYSISDDSAQQIRATSFSSERELQRLFEANLPALLGVRFVASEFATGEKQRGRIDTLGIDEDGTPTIIEYKKSINDNVINQGLFYLDWLVDHKGDFVVAAQQALNSETKIDWSSPRLILIAEEFNEYDKYAVNRIGANIELWTYRLYSDGLLQLEPLFVPEASRRRPADEVQNGKRRPKEGKQFTVESRLKGKPENVRELMELLRERIFTLGDEDEIIEKAHKTYIGYKHGKNFCEVQPQASGLKIWLDISPAELDDPRGMGRDVTEIGHHGTGRVEVRLSELDELEHVSSLIRQSYLLTV